MSKTSLKNHYIYKKEHHPYHLVDPSPWPICTSLALFNLALGCVLYFHRFEYREYILHFSIICLFWFLASWFLDIIVEATFEGHHTNAVVCGLRYGMLLFIVSEIMFFFSFFFSFFYYALSPSIWTGGVWPPVGIVPINPWTWPLLNTIVLLCSGVTLTWAHWALLAGDRCSAITGLESTIFYAIVFTEIQRFEYNTASFCINDTVFGSIFYILTGFHGVHVIVGGIMIIIALTRHFDYQFSRERHFGLIAASWYWHFVDVVWLFLFIIVYIWGSWNKWCGLSIFY